MIEIDGSYLEGGGQIVRTALAFSALTGKNIQIKNIRKGRSQPGLKKQHLAAVNALKDICDAEVYGNELGSSSLMFKPASLTFRNLNIDIGTAGSITLLLQALLPVILFSDKRLKIQIEGGTDTLGSMPVDYFQNVFLPHISKYARIDSKLERRGYYPKGGGKLTLRIKPKYFRKNHAGFIDFMSFLRKEDKKIFLPEQGNLLAVFGRSHASMDLMKANVSERQAKAAKFFLGNLDCSKKIDIEYTETKSSGSGVALWAVFSKFDEMNKENPVILGADCLGKKGKKSEKIGEEASKKLLEEIRSGGAADSHLADQLLPYLALFGGEIKSSRITDHCRTNIYVIEKILGTKYNMTNNLIII
ncbi:MAG: RNA 3'-terminal phosphate cyclase [archaeon]